VAITCIYEAKEITNRYFVLSKDKGKVMYLIRRIALLVLIVTFILIRFIDMRLVFN